MAQQHLDPTQSAAGPTARLPAAPERGGPPTGDALADYLRAQATEFLRALRLHRESGGGPANGSADSVDAARALRRSVRRISGSLHTFRPLLDPDWSESLRPELAWLSGILTTEHAYQARLERLLLALHRLSGATLPAQTPSAVAGSRTGPTAAGLAAAGRSAAAESGGVANGDVGNAGGASAGVAGAGGAESGPPAGRTAAPERGNLTVGAAKAGALLERQLTLARTRAHSTALQALGSSRFHAVADSIAVLASEVPLTPAAPATALDPLAAAAEERLRDAVVTLPLVTAGSPYNAEALVHGLSPDPAPHPQDAPWHQVRLLLRLHRYTREVLQGDTAPVDVRLVSAGQALDRHRDASEAAAAAAAAARTPRIAPATAYALGVLHADQRHEVEAARFTFQQSWLKRAVHTP
ncbi:CHAD domain-containing protein [Streptomyces sp. NPDC005574]|uniref:CHAD domain-containing protein n=1 Tax=Streptomyces sp. NPDC005574 TaxID=3156891 RepID=UPI0033B05D8D